MASLVVLEANGEQHHCVLNKKKREINTSNIFVRMFDILRSPVYFAEDYLQQKYIFQNHKLV